MARMIQIRNVPDEVHRKLKVRAAQAGMTLSDYLLKDLQRSMERPTMEELLERIARRPRVRRLVPSAADLVRAERDSR